MKQWGHQIKLKNNVMKGKTKKITFTPTYTKQNQKLLQHSQKQSPKTVKPSPTPQHISHQPHQNSNQHHFLTSINGYIDQLRGQNKTTVAEIKKRIKKEKLINRSLHLNIIEIQKVLLERTQKLEQLEEIVYGGQKQQDRPSYFKYRSQIETEICSEESEESEFEEDWESWEEGSRRRKTETPVPLEKLILRQKEEKQRNRTKEKYGY